MKTFLTMCAMMAVLAVGGKAMACGGGSSARLSRLTVQKTYRSPVQAARNATAYAMNRGLKGQDSSTPTLAGRELKVTRMSGSLRSGMEKFKVLVKPNDDTFSGSAKVSTRKSTQGWRATVTSGSVDASW